MSPKKVYLCPSCQAVFKSDQETPVGLTCGECGFEFGGQGRAEKTDISKALVAGVSKAKSSTSSSIAGSTVVRDVMKGRGSSEVREASSVDEMVFAEGAPIEHEELPPGEDQVVLKDGTRIRRRRKRKKEKEKHRKLYFFLTLWLGIAAAILVIVQLNKETNIDPDFTNGNNEEEAKQRRDQIFFREHTRALKGNFLRFILSAKEESRLQEIDMSPRLAASFSKFHQSNSIPQPESGLGLTKRKIIELQKEPFSPAVELEWNDEKGNVFESVHLWDGKKWKLDWEHYVRYSTAPWTLFRANIGKEVGEFREGEFRLLVRKRKTLKEADYLSILFYEEPQVGVENYERALRASVSPEINLRMRSDLGKEMLKVFQDFEDEKRPYDSILGDDDPASMARVSVILAWEEDDYGNEVMELKGITGVSWYGTRIRKAYRIQQKALEEFSDDPVVPQLGDENPLLEGD